MFQLRCQQPFAASVSAQRGRPFACALYDAIGRPYQQRSDTRTSLRVVDEMFSVSLRRLDSGLNSESWRQQRDRRLTATLPGLGADSACARAHNLANDGDAVHGCGRVAL